jgi:vacuolar-type H+-ATPase subunit C/Vma6
MALYRFWRGLARREMSGYPFKLGAILGYLVLEELEARDIVTLLEAKSLGWGPDLIQQHLVRRRE